MKSVRIAIYFSIILHFARKIREKACERPDRSRWRVEFDISSGRVLDILRDTSNKIRANKMGSGWTRVANMDRFREEIASSLMIPSGRLFNHN